MIALEVKVVELGIYSYFRSNREVSTEGVVLV